MAPGPCNCNQFDENVFVGVTNTTLDPIALTVGNDNEWNDRRAQLALLSSNPNLGTYHGQPAIRFGKYRGEADNLRLRFLTHEEVEVACVTNAGRVGIGTTKPFSPLANVDKNVVDRAPDAAGVNPLVSLTWGGAGVGYMLAAWNEGTFGNAHGALFRTTATGASNRILTLTSGPDPTGAAVRMAVTGQGKVGIGTSAPATMLEVAGVPAGESTDFIRKSTTTDHQIGFSIRRTDPNANVETYLYAPNSTTAFRVYHGDADRIAVLADGKIGIGHIAPVDKLL